jgi:hypothetical protein
MRYRLDKPLEIGETISKKYRSTEIRAASCGWLNHFRRKDQRCVTHIEKSCNRWHTIEITRVE